MSDDQPSLEQRAAIERRTSGEQTADRIGIQSQHQEIQKRKFNPEFLSQLQDADVDTERFPWLENEFGPVFSGGHILGNRQRTFERQQEYLNANKAERYIAERTPGRLLKRHPKLLALWQGVDETDATGDPTTHPDYNKPIDQQMERRVARDAMEVATTRQSLSVDGKGVDSVTTATTENRTVASDESDSSSVRERIAGFLG